MTDLFGEPDIPINHKRHKLVKLTLPNQKIMCLKIITLPAEALHLIDLYKTHFERVKQWLRMRFSGRKYLVTLALLQTSAYNILVPTETNRELTLLHVTTEYSPHPNLEQYYQMLAQKAQKKIQLPRTTDTYLYYFQQFFEVVLRGASIPFFFYSPANIFINRPPSRINNQIGRLTVNVLSTVGLELLGDRGEILKQDLKEIFPLLPSNLAELAEMPQQDYVREVNRIIRMKALVWNILCFILRFIPKLLSSTIKDKIVKYDDVMQLLSTQQKRIQQLLASKQVFQLVNQAKKQTGIQDLFEIIKDVLQKNCQGQCWEKLYSQLFLQNKVAKQRREQYKAKMGEKIPKERNIDERISLEESQGISRMVLKGFWQIQQPQIKKFYRQRSIPPSSNVYFLIRTNISFRSMMGHLNILHFCQEAPFSSDLLNVHLAFMRNSYKKVNDKLPQLPPETLVPYRPRILPPPSAGDPPRDLVSAEVMSRALGRRVSVSRTQVVLTHDMLDTLNRYRRNDWIFNL